MGIALVIRIKNVDLLWWVLHKCRPWGFNWTSIEVWIEHAAPSSNIIISPQFFLNARWHCFPFSHPLQMDPKIFCNLSCMANILCKQNSKLARKTQKHTVAIEVWCKNPKSTSWLLKCGLSSKQWRCDVHRREGKEIGM